MRALRLLGFVIVASVCACGDSTGSGGGGGSVSSGGEGGGTGGDNTGGTPVTTGGGGEGGAGGGGDMTPCEEICAFNDSLEETLMCGYDGTDCIPTCEQGFNDTPEDCQDEAIAYNDCLIAQPPADFNCTGMTFTLTGGACDDPYNALVACVTGG